MTVIVSIYKGFRLTTVEQSGGGFRAEIVPIAGGKPPVLTQTFRERSGAIASARRMVDQDVATS
jgi:hypothetical protein